MIARITQLTARRKIRDGDNFSFVFDGRHGVRTYIEVEGNIDVAVLFIGASENSFHYIRLAYRRFSMSHYPDHHCRIFTPFY